MTLLPAWRYLVSTTLRLLSVRLLLILLAAALAAVALITAVSPAGPGRHGATLGAGHQSVGKVSQSYVDWE